MSTNYLKQTNEPLFPDLVWSRPETKHGAGKLLIIGGQAQEFVNVAESYNCAEKAGAGTVRVFLPDSTHKVTKMLPNIEYAQSNISGSFSRNALAELLDASQWADGVLLAGDLGKNSETTLMLESFVSKYNGLLIITGNALSSLSVNMKDLFSRPQTCITVNLDELQKIAIQLELEKPVTSSVGEVELAQILELISEKYPAILTVQQNNKIWCAYDSLVAVSIPKQAISPMGIAGRNSVWLIQNPLKPFEAVISSLL